MVDLARPEQMKAGKRLLPKAAGPKRPPIIFAPSKFDVPSNAAYLASPRRIKTDTNLLQLVLNAAVNNCPPLTLY